MCGFRLRRLRRVLATALLCLPLFAGLTTEAAAQTDVSQRIVPPATLTVGEGDGSVDITLTGKPDYDLTDVQINSVSSGDAVGSITSTCASGQDLIINNSGNAHIITARIADTSHTYSALTLCDDSDDEPDETTTLGWTSGCGDPFNGNAANCTLNSVCTTLLTIQDNDPTVVSLDRVGSGAVTEGATVEFRVTLGRALVAGEIIDVPLSIGGTNVTTSDWSLAEKRGPGLNRGVTLSATNTATPKVRFSGAGARTATLELTTTTSDLSENTETFTIALGSGTAFDVNTLGTNVGGGADPSSTANSFSVTVNNVAKGTLELVGIPQDSNEGNSGSTNKSFSVRLTSGGTVSYTVCVNRNADKGTATADRGTDWDWGSGSRSNCLTGETLTSTGTPRKRSYTFRILGDTDYEEDETIIVRLLSNNSEKATLGKSTFTYTIKNDDAAPVVSIERVSSPVTEGTEAKFTVSASPSPASSLTVKYTVTDAPGADFVSTTNQGSGKTITLGTSGMATITVATQADSNDEPDGPVTVTVNSGTGYTVGNTNTATVTVNDNDPTRVTLSGAPGDVVEGTDKTFTVTLERGLRNGESLVVPLTFAGEATRGTDYTTACPNPLPSGVACHNLNSGSNSRVTFTGPSSGATARAVTLTLSASTDNSTESGGETVNIGLETLSHGGLSGGATKTDSLATFRINDPTQPVITISGGSAVTEGTAATFTVSASPVPESSLTVNYTVTDAPGADFVSTTNQGSGKTISLGTSATATITVATQADSNDEPSGPVTVTVNDGNGYVVGSASTATVTVNDDDAPSTPGITDGGTSTPPPTDDDDSDGSPEDREALESIYGTAGGTGWENDLNWGSDEPLGQWYGVTVEDGRVTELLLEGNNLSGTIHEDIGGLEKLKRLYLNDNRLTGTVPLEIGDLAELGELALWGNPGLETIPEGFEKMVDRAVLRTLYDVNGPVGSWFPEEGELFDYSGWEGVSADSDGRISGLDLSGGGLSKEITGAISELSALEVLDLSGNADLAGELPSGLMDTELLTLDICGTGIRVSDNEELREWLSGIEFTYPEDCGDSEPESEDNEPMEAESSGGGGCAVASGEFNEEAYHLVMVALAAVALGRRKNRKTEVSSAER